MTRFQFRLQRVLEWRGKQLELEEARFKQCLAEVADVDQRRTAMEAAQLDAERQLRHRGNVLGQDLAALAGYRRFAQDRIRRLALERVEAGKRLAAQEQTMLEARRRCRLLERLRERRLVEWEAAADKELDEVAAESHLARWARAGSRD